MAKKTPIEKLSAEIGSILDEYAEDVRDNLDDITEQIGKKGVQALRSSARSEFGGTGVYAKGWKAKIERGRLDTSVAIYNAKVPGLPHMLEHGHAKRGGGRVRAIPHIAPAEAAGEEQLVSEIERALK